MTDSRKYALVEILSPYGKIIQCAKQKNVLIPITKITQFGFGRIQFIEQRELAQLRMDRRRDQRKFARNEKKLKCLKRLDWYQE